MYQPDEARISDAVMASMNTVQRHELVPQSGRRFAYENRPLPIGYGQTISQPYIVALMTELIEPDADDVVLEVGTGSGYQAAILAALVGGLITGGLVMYFCHRLGDTARDRLKFRGIKRGSRP